MIVPFDRNVYKKIERHALLGDQSVHLLSDTNGRIYPDIDKFMIELERAFEKYAAELQTDAGIRQLAILRYDRYPIMNQIQYTGQGERETYDLFARRNLGENIIGGTP